MPLPKVLIPVSLAAITLAACGAQNATTPHAGSAPHRGGTLTVLWSGDVDSIDPGQTYYAGGYMVANVTQRAPMAYEPGRADARPDLATKAPEVSVGGRTVTVHLRSGVHFSPPVKREVTSADVKYAIERGFYRTVNNPYAGAYFGDLVGAKVGVAPGTTISGIRTPDAHTVVFKLSSPTGGTLAAALVLPLAAPVPRDYALRFDRAKASTYGTHQVATGPYMVSSYKPSQKITLVRNPSWSATTDFRPAYLDKIVMPEGNDEASIASRRILEGSDMASGDFLIPPAQLKDAVTKHQDQITLVASGGARWTAMNTKVAPFNNVNVRKAVVAGFNREAALLALGGKTVGSVATHFLPPGTPGHDSAGPTPDFLANPNGNPALAAAYLKKAGFASGRYSGPPIEMIGPIDGLGRQISEIAKTDFEALGFKVKMRLLSQQVVMTRFCGYPAAEVQVCPNVGWTRDFADGQTFLDPTFSGKNILPQGNMNQSQLNDPAVNAAIEQAKTLTDPTARAKAWGAVDGQITALAPAVPLVWDRTPMVHSADVKGVANENLGVWDFAFTSIK